MPLDHARIRALLFDIDGTLRDTDDELVDRVASMLRPFGRALPANDPKRAARRFVMRVESPVQRCLGVVDRTGIDRHAHALVTRWASLRGAREMRLIDGVREMLAELGPRYELAVVSAGPRGAVERFLRQHDLSDVFSAVATGLTCRHTKPAPDPVLWAARTLGVAPAQCVLIGDTTADVIAARRAGAQSIGVLCGFGERDELEHAGVDAILASTGELTALLRGAGNAHVRPV